jgi:hypothetical protein
MGFNAFFIEENVFIIKNNTYSYRSRVAQSGYGLDDRAIEVRSPAEATVIFL